MEVLEPVAFAKPNRDEKECPFDHEEKVHDKENKLARNMSAFEGAMGNDHQDHLTAHHLIPVATMKAGSHQLLAWIDKDESQGKLQGDIGYDINCANNGLDLPSGKSITRKFWATPEDSMRDTGCQYHTGGHPWYNDFVVKVLDAIGHKFTRAEEEGYPGCGKKDCSGRKGEPYAPPYGMVPRLDGISRRLKQYLLRGPKAWRKPIMVSSNARTLIV